jgi:hypothetical protein
VITRYEKLYREAIKHKMKTKIVFFLFALAFVLQTNAQCAMCRAVLESEEGQGVSKGINDGIIYLMAIPYILVFGVGFVIYWKYFRVKKKSAK